LKMINSMKNQSDLEGNQKLQINKGIEFMLRRRVDKVKPKHGLILSKTFSLLRRTFHFHLEFSWEVDKPTRE
jgi:hypothetical protein